MKKLSPVVVVIAALLSMAQLNRVSVNQPVTLFTSSTVVQNVSTGETDLLSYTMPANTLSANGQKLRIDACWTTAANTNSKTARLYWNGSAILTQATTSTGDHVCFQSIHTIRTGASTQAGFAGFLTSTGGGVARANTSPGSANTASTIVIKITGQSATASNDIASEYLSVEWWP